MQGSTRVRLLAALALAGCGPPVVEVETRVGDPAHDAPARERLEALRKVVATAFREDPEEGVGERDANFVATPPRTPKELADIVESIGTTPINELETPVRNLAAADAAIWPHLRLMLLAERKSPKGDYRSLLALIGGDLPNRYGHFALAWKKAHGYAVKLSEDWHEDLLAEPASRIMPALRPVYRDTLQTTALLRAAARIGREHPEHTASVVHTLLDAGYVHDGTFRDEVGRAMVAVGDAAVPTLVRASIPPSGADENSLEFRRAQYASYNLDRMDRMHPARALASVHESPRRLADLLDAYALARPPAAAEPILALVDTRDPNVRASAKAAFLAYVLGPPPRAERKTLRLLGGGTTTTSSGQSHRYLALLAIRGALEQKAPDLLEPPCKVTLPDGTPDHACEGQPARLTKAWLSRLEMRRNAERDALIARALASDDREAAAEMLDGLLASVTPLETPETLAPFFEEAAEDALARGDPRRSAQLLRKSAMLAESSSRDHAQELRVRALVREASVDELDLQGREMLLRSAAELAPDSDEVRSALSSAHARAVREPWTGLFGLRVGFAILALGLFVAAIAGRLLRRALRRA